MKTCPSCGYEETPSNRQLLAIYKKEFGDIPVRHMLKRGWLGDVEPDDISGLEEAILKFFGVKNEDELWAKFSKPLPGVVCSVYDDRGRLTT